jgi:hypothetical protein
MSLSERDRQALAAIEDQLASSDPGLAAMLACFSRLTAGEDMPARESMRPRQRLSWAQRTLALWLAITMALIGAAMAARHAGGARACPVWPTACAAQRLAHVTQPAGR